MVRHYIGATTLNDGKATFPYLCKGSGELTIKASVREGSEALFEDKGTSASYNDNWTGSGTTRTRNDTDTKIVQTSASTVGFYVVPYSDNQIIEFDMNIEDYSGNAISFRKGSNNNLQVTFWNAGFHNKNTWEHIKIVSNNGTISVSVNGTETYTGTLNNDFTTFLFRMEDGYYIKYRNFIIYQLGSGEETISTPTPIDDCIAYDNCTSADHNDATWDINTNATFVRGDTYTSYKQTNTSNNAIIYLLNLFDGCTINMELKQVDGSYGNGLFNIYSASGALTYFSLQSLGYTSTDNPVGEWIKLRLTIDGTSATLTDIDDSTKTKTNTWSSGTPNRLRFILSSSGITEFQFKSIKIYPI